MDVVCFVFYIVNYSAFAWHLKHKKDAVCLIVNPFLAKQTVVQKVYHYISI